MIVELTTSRLKVQTKTKFLSNDKQKLYGNSVKFFGSTFGFHRDTGYESRLHSIL